MSRGARYKAGTQVIMWETKPRSVHNICITVQYKRVFTANLKSTE